MLSIYRTDHGRGGLRSKNGFREGGIAGSSGDEAREENVERERRVLGAGPDRVLASSGRGESRNSHAGAGGAQVGEKER